MDMQIKHIQESIPVSFTIFPTKKMTISWFCRQRAAQFSQRLFCPLSRVSLFQSCNL